MPILSKRLSVHLMKKAVAFELLWFYNVMLCFLDNGESHFMC